MQALLAWRGAMRGDFGWTVTWLRAWFEWQRIRKRYSWMKVSSNELERIQRQIAAPLESPFCEQTHKGH